MANGRLSQNLIIKEIFSKRGFWNFLSKEHKGKANSIVHSLWLEAKRYAEEKGIISKLPSEKKKGVLSKYKRLAKTIDFSEKGSKKEQAREEYKTVMATRPFIRRALRGE